MSRPRPIKAVSVRRRACLALGVAAMVPALVLTAALPAAHAAESTPATYPDKPVRFIVPVSAGGSTDKIARVIAEKLAIQWGQTVLVENITGAGGTIGAARVARSKPDGYTLLLHSDAVVLNLAMYSKPGYTLDDLSGVIRAIVNPQVLVVKPSLGIKTFQDYVALAKQKPGEVSVALPTSGGIAHIAHEMVRQRLGIQVNYIPYAGGAPAATDVMGGHVDATIITAAAVTEYIKAGRLIPLAVTTSYRSPAMPDVPTIAEVAVPGFDVESWQGILAPAGTPRQIVEKINRDVAAVLAQPDVRKSVESQGYGISGGTPQQFDAALRDDYARYSKVIKSSGITLQ